MEYYIKKRIKHVWARFKWLIILYFLFWILWFFIKLNVAFFENIFTSKFHFTSDFFTAWFSGLSEDLFFFGTGFLGLVLSTKLLRDEDFETRISALANGRNISREGELELAKNIKKLLSYNTHYETVIEIEEIDTANIHIFAHVDMTCIVANVCEDEEMPAAITTFVEPGEKINGTYGTIYHHIVSQLIPPNYKPSKNVKISDTKYVIKKGHNLDMNTLGGQNYVYKQDYYIVPDGEAKWELAFGAWAPINQNKLDKKKNWFFNSFNAYTENYSFKLVNNLTKTVKFDVSYPNRLTNDNQIVTIENQEIKSGEGKTIVSDVTFHKDDSFSIYFFL
jgi:hypothetical protein